MHADSKRRLLRGLVEPPSLHRAEFGNAERGDRSHTFLALRCNGGRERNDRGSKMKIQVENLGILKQAEFELGELTVICGGNNTGKTYATYALFGFLSRWERLLKARISDAAIQDLMSDGVTRVDISSYANEAKHILKQGCLEYTRQLPGIFASIPDRFEETKFRVSIDTETTSAIGELCF